MSSSVTDAIARLEQHEQYESIQKITKQVEQCLAEKSAKEQEVEVLRTKINALLVEHKIMPDGHLLSPDALLADRRTVQGWIMTEMRAWRKAIKTGDKAWVMYNGKSSETGKLAIYRQVTFIDVRPLSDGATAHFLDRDGVHSMYFQFDFADIESVQSNNAWCYRVLPPNIDGNVYKSICKIFGICSVYFASDEQYIKFEDALSRP